jgi:hypothetical protein
MSERRGFPEIVVSIDRSAHAFESGTNKPAEPSVVEQHGTAALFVCALVWFADLKRRALAAGE